jgi:hypothetical protein
MNAAGPALFASPKTVRTVSRARALVVLVGSYDGSGNYGDVAQLDAALELVERLGPGVLALPVLERGYLSGHRELAADSGPDPSLPLFFDPEGKLEDDLLPVAAPAELAFAATYLYGGGYLNRLWGRRKLAMLGAADALLAAGGIERPDRLASGLQVEPEWVAGLSDSDGAALRDCDPLGARDPGSRRALEALSSGGNALESGDDAIGLLPEPPAAGPEPAGADLLQVNVHFAEHEWVSETPTRLPGFYAGLLAELGRRAGLPVLARPLIAYQDGRVDERPALAHLRDACAAAGVELAEPRLLRPAGLAAAVPSLHQASLTVSCSYHVALTSLMLAVPALLVADNPYYEQKAAGLRATFDLPPSFAPASTAEPAAVAAEIAAVLLDPGQAERLRRNLAAAASRSRRRRAATEAQLLARLGAAATAALNERLEGQAERLRQRSAEPVELQARLAQRQTELEELRWRAADGPLEAELRAQQAEASARQAHETLATILGSRSWRLMAPLRRLGALLRRR